MSNLRKCIALTVPVTLLCTALLLVACSKKEAAQVEPRLLDSALLAKIPSSASFFSIWDAESQGYKSFRESPWAAGRPDFYQICARFSGDQAEVLPRICRSLTTAGFIQGADIHTPTIRESILFGGYDPTSKLPQAGLYFSAAAGVNLKDKLSSLESALKTEGFAVNRHDFKGNAGFSVELPSEPEKSLPVKTIYAGASSTYFAVASSAEAVEQLFIQNPESALQRIKSSAEFNRLSAVAGNRAGQIFYAYADLKHLLKMLEQSGILATIDSPAQPAEFPLEAALAVSYMDENPAGFALVSTSPRNDNQSRWLAAFKTDGNLAALKALPSESALALGIDGQSIRSLRDTALNEQPADLKNNISARLAPLDDLKSLGLALLPPSGAAPLPSLVLSFQAGDLEKLKLSLREALGAGVTSTGLPVSGWQEKKIAGVEAAFMQSPMMGLGVFLAAHDKTLLVGSSEDALVRSISSLGGKNAQSTLGQSLSDKSKAMYDQGSPLAAFYTNYPVLASLIESFQGTLSAFSSGQSPVDDEQIKRMKAMGLQIGALAFKDGIFRARMTMELPKAKE